MFLSSCKDDFPAIKPQVRCVNVLLDEKNIDGVLYYSGYCRCHLYAWTLDSIGRVGESTDYELLKCNKLIGFEPDTYGTIYMWWESIRLWLVRHSK
jgi:hypothetical protein